MDTTTAKALALRVSVKIGTDEQEALQLIWLGCVDGALRPLHEDGEPFPVHVPTEEMEPVVDLWGRRLPRAYAVAKNLATTFEDFEQVSHALRFRARDADDFLAYLDARAIERAAESTPPPPAAPEPQAEAGEAKTGPASKKEGRGHRTYTDTQALKAYAWAYPKSGEDGKTHQEIAREFWPGEPWGTKAGKVEKRVKQAIAAGRKATPRHNRPSSDPNR